VYELPYRLSTIQAADRIVVMDGGQIVEVGKQMIHFECPKILNIVKLIHKVRFGRLYMSCDYEFDSSNSSARS